MPRFKWNDPKNGRLINRYIDMICTKYPSIAKNVVKHGIGDLNYWFKPNKESADSTDANKAMCGCLVGTTALVAMQQLPGITQRIDTDTTDAPLVLYDLIVKKSKRDTSKYTRPDRSGYLDQSYMIDPVNARQSADPLLVLIYDAGMAASTESRIDDVEEEGLDWDESLKANALREARVVGHMEMRIRDNLGLPHPKVKSNG